MHFAESSNSRRPLVGVVRHQDEPSGGSALPSDHSCESGQLCSDKLRPVARAA